MSVTIKDVAREVGVAPSTVSRALKDHPSISEETKERVRKAMDKLGYVPNVAARNLASNLSNAVGVILPALGTKDKESNPFYLEVIAAINEEASHHQMTVSLATGENQEELLKNVQLMYRQKRVDGFILLYVREDDQVLDYLVDQHVPFTIIGQPYKYHNEASCVDNDNQILGRTATQYLIDKGHSNVLFVTNTENENFFKERYLGYRRCLKEQNLKVLDYSVLKEASDFLALKDKITSSQVSACIAIDDMFALRLIQFIQLNDWSVPDDISVISFNNSIFSTLIHPYITSIDVNSKELGHLALQEFLEQLKKTDSVKKRIIIPHRLIERETVISYK